MISCRPSSAARPLRTPEDYIDSPRSSRQGILPLHHSPEINSLIWHPSLSWIMTLPWTDADYALRTIAQLYVYRRLSEEIGSQESEAAIPRHRSGIGIIINWDTGSRRVRFIIRAQQLRRGSRCALSSSPRRVNVIPEKCRRYFRLIPRYARTRATRQPT